MHHIDNDKAYREKARWNLHKNAPDYIKQILETTATNFSSLKPSKLDGQYIRDAAREVKDKLISHVLW